MTWSYTPALSRAERIMTRERAMGIIITCPRGGEGGRWKEGR